MTATDASSPRQVLRRVGQEEAGNTAAAAAQNDNDGEQLGPVGCYLVYEPNSSGRFIVHYSEGYVPENAVGFWLPGPGEKIQGFKFKQAGGRSELIKGIAGGDANKRKYYIGWCQFLKQCKAKKGRVIQFEQEQSIPVDVYGFISSKCQPVMLNLDSALVDLSEYDSIAVMQRHHAFLKGVNSIQETNFLELGNLAGASTTMSK